MISKVWKVVILSELCEYISRGVTPSYTDCDGVQILNQKCIRNNRISYQQARLTNPKTKKIPGAKYLQIHDILINSTGVGTLGRVAQINEINGVATVDSHVTIVRAKKSVNARFLGYNLVMQQPNIEALAEGSTGQTELSRIRLADTINILLPPLEEQQLIADTLSCIDEKIDLNLKINDNLEQQVQGIFKSYFIDFEPYQIDISTSIPSGWEFYKLGDVSEMYAGGDKPKIFSKIPTETCKIPIYSNGIDNFGLFGYTNIARITSESVTVSARGTIGFTCLRETPYVPIVRLVSIIPNEEFLSNKYLYIWLKNSNISGTGTTQQQLTVPDFKRTKILIPNNDVMQQFTFIVTPLFARMASNRAENEKLTELRDSLLPKLMSGEFNVKS